QLKISAVLSYAAIFMGMCYQLLLTPLATRVLGPSEFGMYSVCISIQNYIALMWAGLSAAYTRYYFRFIQNGEHDRARQLNGVIVLLFGVVSAVIFIAGFGLSFHPQTMFGSKLSAQELVLAARLLRFMSVAGAVLMLAVPFEIMIIAQERFIFNKAVLIVRNLFLLGMSALVLKSGMRSTALLIVVLCGAVLYCAVQMTFCLKKLKIRFSRRGFPRLLLIEILVFAFFILLQSAVEAINFQSDKILVSRILDTASAGVYAVGGQLALVLMSFTAAITGLFIPRVNRIAAENAPDKLKSLSDLLIKTGRAQFIVVALMFTGILFFGRPFIIFYAGEQYGGAYIVAVLLALPLVLQMTMDLGQNITRAENRHKPLVVINLVLTILLFFLRIPLCRRFGITGAALGTCICIFVTQILVNYVYYVKIVGLDMSRWVKSIARLLPPLLPPAIFGVLLMLFVNIQGIIALLLYAAAYAAIYAVSFFMLGISREERGRITGAIIDKLPKRG
ncbi:MAG: oligosaccharide flippase family protein, partial [Oscillospiraceae bacterium]|nr:oligosaccharide flippase family protein [Oscillospiraceae bacterium]